MLYVVTTGLSEVFIIIITLNINLLTQEDDTFGPSLMQIDENFSQNENFIQHRTQENKFVTPIGEPFKTPSSRRSRRRETLAVS